VTQSAIPEASPMPSMSLAQWELLPEDEPGELVDGRLEEEEVSSFVHELIVLWFGSLLRAWARPRGGFVFGSDAKFVLKPTRGRKPDLSVFLPGGRKPPSHGASRIPADIMVEVVSPTPRDGRRDRVEKVKEYAAFGVRWYWIVDPELRSFEILELEPSGRYALAVSMADGAVSEVPGCEELVIDLDALWAEADQLESEEGASE
jgi:Uma2 family endonuclease